MKEIKVKITVYETVNGLRFRNKKDCEEWEKRYMELVTKGILKYEKVKDKNIY